MKRRLPFKIFIGICCFFLLNTAKAQFVTIPDINFVAWLNNNGYSQCLNGNQLDTTCPAVVNAVIVSCSGSNISDLTGIEYFTSLDTLLAYNNPLTTLPPLPATLTHLECGSYSLTSLPTLPPGLIYLDCSLGNLTVLPALPNTLEFFYCDNNLITSIPSLPTSLVYFSCQHNLISSLPALPATLQTLYCGYNPITSLPVLPGGLLYLSCIGDSIATFSILPASLYTFAFGSPTLTNIPPIPVNVTQLDIEQTNFANISITWPTNLLSFYCTNNPHLNSLPPLPSSISYLGCSRDSLTSLPPLPSSLIQLDCSQNLLTIMPSLPAGVTGISCEFNLFTSLPALPASLSYLNCSGNINLSSLPTLPPYVWILYCYGDSNLRCLPPLTTIHSLDIRNTGITCLPNYGNVTTSVPPLSSIPLCDVNNIQGCQTYWNITGQTFLDANSNCLYDSAESIYDNIKVQLLRNGVMEQLAFTHSGGYYSFDVDTFGVYNVSIDTTNLPLNVFCPAANIRADTISGIDSMWVHQDFALTCPTGFDIGCWSIVPGIFIPNSENAISTQTGDISGFFNGHCATGISGTVTLTFTGPVTYVGPAGNALVPSSVNGNTITWNVADFGVVNLDSAFNIITHTNFNAQAGSQVCFTVSVTPVIGDNNPANNMLSQCFTTLAAWDPNYKEVYPSGIIDSSQHWLTYTIHFQNTGTAAASNIHIDDTIDVAHLDISSIQLLAYSSQPTVQVHSSGATRFNFAGIDLPDSTVSFVGSQGYVQYKIKLRNNLVPGTKISNTASIYFDFNPAVATNTVTDTLAGAMNPIAVNDYAGVIQPHSDTINVTANDTTTIGDTLCVTSVYGSAHFSILDCNNLIFKPDTSFIGNDTCWYVVCGNTSGLCDTAMVVVTDSANYSLWPVAGMVSDSAYDAQQGFPHYTQGCGVLFPNTYNPYTPEFRVENFSLNADSISWTVSGLGYTYSVCADSVILSDTITTNAMDLYYGWGNRCEFGGVGGPPFIEFCLTAFNKYGSNTICDTTCYMTWEGIPVLPPNSISIYPNPANDILFIKTDGFYAETITMYSVNGQKISESKFAPQIDISQLSSGVYFIEVRGEGNVVRKRFVKM